MTYPAEKLPFAPEQDNACVGSSLFSTRALRLAVLVAMTPASVYAWEETCAPFHEVYDDGQDLCNTIFGDSFAYEADDSAGYTMWFFDRENPNKATAEALGMTSPDTCELQYFHKEAPSPEGEDFTECLPWKEDACCHEATVTSAESLRMAYGPGYEWDRCGPMSPECARFFVQEACFYECDPTAGLYRKCSDAQVAGAVDGDECFENTWQIERMPIKGSYCDAWYSACRNDYFCSGKDFFSCEALYWENLEADQLQAAEAAAQALADAQAKEGMPGYAVAIIVAVIVLALGGTLAYVIRREKRGDPIFASLVAPGEDQADAN